MTIYLYCLTDAASEPATDLRGLGGEPVRVVRAAGHAVAWVSDLPAGLGPATPEQARVHDLVVRAAMSRETPLPARFGQTFAGEGALRHALALEGRSEGIARALERVRGGVEMTVRMLLSGAVGVAAPQGILGSAAPAAEPEPEAGAAAHWAPAGAQEGHGRAYMARLRDRQQGAADVRKQAEFLQARVAHAVGAFVRTESCSPLSSAAHSFSVSHLVAREAVGQYRLAIDSLVVGDPTLRLLVSGPWAPYSFARIADG